MIAGFIFFSPIYFFVAYMSGFNWNDSHTLYGYGLFCIQLVVYHFFLNMIESFAQDSYAKTRSGFPPSLIVTCCILLFSIIAVIISKWYLSGFVFNLF